MTKFYAAAFGTYNASTSRLPWEDDIRDFYVELGEVVAEDMDEAEELAWELLEPVMHRIESEEDIYSADWQLWWE